MNNKQLILIMITILVGACIVAEAIIYTTNPHIPTNNTTVSNNTTDRINNINENENNNVETQSEDNPEYFINKDTGEKVYYNDNPNKGQIVTKDSPKSKYEDPRWIEANEMEMAS